MVEDSQIEENMVCDAKGLARFFQLDVSIKLFGQDIVEWLFPAKS